MPDRAMLHRIDSFHIIIATNSGAFSFAVLPRVKRIRGKRRGKFCVPHGRDHTETVTKCEVKERGTALADIGLLLVCVQSACSLCSHCSGKFTMEHIWDVHSFFYSAARYSTVTDFARFFGLSMSQPFSLAT